MEKATGMHLPAGDKKDYALALKPHDHYLSQRSIIYINLNVYLQRIQGTFWETFKIGKLLNNL